MHALIAAVSRSRQPSGICRHAANLVRCLDAQPGITRITLVLGYWQLGYFQDDLGLKSAKLCILLADARNTSLSRNYWYRYSLPSIAGELQAGIVHLTYPVPLDRAAFHAPVVMTLHDLYPYDMPRNFGFPQAYFHRAILRQCLRDVDATLCVSNATLQRLYERMPALANHAFVIPNCVDLAPDGPTINPLLRWNGGPLLLCVAQHRANKNIAGLFHTFAALLRRGELDPKATLVLMGSAGPETRRLQALAHQLSIESHITILDNVVDAELLWLYRNCDLLVAPSILEGFSFPVAEALLCSCRVACSDIEVHREIAYKAAEYFDPSSSAEMQKAILTAIGKARIPAPESLRQFSSASIGRQYMNLYRRMIPPALPKTAFPVPQPDAGTNTLSPKHKTTLPLHP